MKKIVRFAAIATIFAALMLACTPSTEGPVGENPDTEKPEDPAEELVEGEYEKPEGEDGGHIEIVPGDDLDLDDKFEEDTYKTDEDGNIVEDEDGNPIIEEEGRTNEEFIEDIENEFKEGGLDDLELNEDNTWSMTIKPSALIPGLIPPKYQEGEKFMTIPEGFTYADPSEFVYVIDESKSLLQLKMPRRTGEDILMELLPSQFDYVFDPDNKSELLGKFVSGIFRVTNDYISLNYKYKVVDGVTTLYVDKDMMLTTLGYVKEIGDAAESHGAEMTVELRDILDHINNYIAFLQKCETFEVGTNFTPKLGNN